MLYIFRRKHWFLFSLLLLFYFHIASHGNHLHARIDIPLDIKYSDDFVGNNEQSQLNTVPAHNDQIFRMRHSQRIANLLSILDESFLLEEQLTIVFGGKDGPLYDPQTNEIWMPSEFVRDIEQRFRDGYELADENELQLVIEDVMLHTLVHEMGHALIEMYNLPILGREEDAVDALGSVILIESVDDGQTAVLTAADMFALESEDIENLEDADFWGHHSLDEQRYFALLCHVYGSDPGSFTDLIGKGGLGPSRAEDCEYDYPKLVDDWFGVLEPYMAAE